MEDMDNYPIYAEWKIVHSDPCGLEARKNPMDYEEYGLNRVGRYGGIILPMVLLQRGSLLDIASRLSLREGNECILRMMNNYLMKKEFWKFTKDGFNIDSLNGFIKSTYIQLEKKGRL